MQAAVALGGIEFIHYFRLALHGRVGQLLVTVDTEQRISLDGTIAGKPLRIPCVCTAIDFRGSYNRSYLKVLAYIVEYQLIASGRLDCIDHAIDIIGHGFRLIGHLSGFIAHFHKDDIRFILDFTSGITVGVIEQLLHIVLLSLFSCRIENKVGFGIDIHKTGISAIRHLRPL